MIRESHSERSLMRSCLEFIFLFIEVMARLPYSLLLIGWRDLIASLDIRNDFPGLFPMILSFVEPSPVHIVGN